MLVLAPFNGWIIFHYVDEPCFVYPSNSPWTLRCFHLLAIGNNAIVDICVHMFVRTPAFRSLECVLRSRIAGSYGNSTCTPLKNGQTVFHVRCPILHSQQQGTKFPVPLTSSPTLVIFCVSHLARIWVWKLVFLCTNPSVNLSHLLMDI